MKDGGNELSKYIEITNNKDLKGVPPIVHFAIQSDPVGEVGVNGCQARDMLEYVYNLFTSLNNEFPCRENADTLQHIALALQYQDARTLDRENRKVEGKNEK